MKYLSHLPDANPDRLMDSGRFRLSTTRRELMAAFNRVIELSDRRQTTDLHVRRLLCYIRAQDKTYAGAARSIKRIAKKLVLSISTCRSVIRRAVEHFGLLIVIPQIHALGGQTYNRYTINWDQVDALLVDEFRENILLDQAKRVTKDLAILAKATCPSGSDREPSSSSDLSESSATPMSRIDMPVRLGPLAAVSTGGSAFSSIASDDSDNSNSPSGSDREPSSSSDLSSNAPVISDQAVNPHASRPTTAAPVGPSELSSNRPSGSDPVRLALPVGPAQPESSATPMSRIDMPVRLGPLAAVSTGRTGLDPSLPSDESIAAQIICPSGSDPRAASTCPHTSLPNAMCWACRDQALALGIKLTPGWIFMDFQGVTVYHDQPPLPPHLHKVFARLARTPRPSAADLTPRGQTPPFPIKLPDGLPAELLAHFDVLMAKAQAAIDCAQLLCPKRRRPSRRKGHRASRLAPPTKFERLMSRLKYRLFSLLCRIEVTQWRASTPAMCRTYLPPINPEPLPDFAAILKEMAATPLRPDFSAMPSLTPDFSAMPSLTPDFSQFEPLKFDFSGCSIDAAKFFDEADALSDQAPENNDTDSLPVRLGPTTSAPATTDHPSDQCQSGSDLESRIANLLTAINELITAIKAALRCARALRLSWLKKRLISWQRKTKTIRARIHKASLEPIDAPHAPIACAARTRATTPLGTLGEETLTSCAAL